MNNQRAIAASIINDVVYEGQHLNIVIQKYRDRGELVSSFINNLCYSVLRNYFKLAFIVDSLLVKPIKNKDSIVKSLLMVGIYQLQEDSNTTDYAAINESVAAVVELNRDWAKGLVNAILRSYQREFAEINDKVQQNLSVKYSHPQWLIEKLQLAYPKDWQNILQANNQQPLLTLRVNLRKISKESFCEKLNQLHISHQYHQELTAAVTILESVSVTEIPGFKEGWFAVQDGAAQLAVDFLDLKDNLEVLDACSAPGGKSSHILETYSVSLTSIDISALRVSRLKENFQRLGLDYLQPKIFVADLQCIEKWWDRQLYDRILLDAPCSATGVIRRNPDIKLFRTEDEIKNIILIQQQMLNTCWKLLKPRGILLYATCSILPEENQQQIDQFIQNNQDAKLVPIKHDIFNDPHFDYMQILPNQHSMDGFFYAKIMKVANI